ncbi:TatD family hydrolase [soil metagenome]
MVDTHAHVALCEGSPSEVVRRAAEAGVARILNVGLDEESNREVVEIAETNDAVFACVGRHPNSAEGYDEEAAAAIRKLASSPQVRAIGETGLDYFRDGAPRDVQRRAFRSQIEIARELSLPLVIHMRSGEGPERDAVAESLALLEAEADGVEVILHCFSAHPREVERASSHGWYCSFAGNVTYPKSDLLREAAAAVPDDLILVETDSPFLSPQSHRGRPNEPARVVETAALVADVRGVSAALFSSQVEANAARVFRW